MDKYLINAREELLRHIEALDKVRCAEIIYKPMRKDDQWNVVSYLNYDDRQRHIRLKLNYSQDDWEQFLVDLDFFYYAGYGCFSLDGMIWYEDGNWSERGEYDGSEGWEYCACPPIPVELS